MLKPFDVVIIIILVCIILGFFTPWRRRLTTEEVLEKLDYDQWMTWSEVCDKLDCTSPFQKDRVLHLLATAVETGLVDTRNEALAVWERRIPRKEYRKRRRRRIVT